MIYNESMKLILVILLLAATSLSMSGCALLLIGGGAAEGGYVAGKDQPAGQTLRDQAITTSIKTKLIANSKVAARNINVDTDGGIVTLLGTVGSEKEKEIAIKIARATKGVKKVVSNLAVLPN